MRKVKKTKNMSFLNRTVFIIIRAIGCIISERVLSVWLVLYGPPVLCIPQIVLNVSVYVCPLNFLSHVNICVSSELRVARQCLCILCIISSLSLCMCPLNRPYCFSVSTSFESPQLCIYYCPACGHNE